MTGLVILIFAILLPVYAIAGGLAYRLRGGGFFPLPGLVRRPLAALLLTLPIWLLAPWWAALAVLGATTVFVSLGHGDWLDWGTSGRTDVNEWLNPLLHRVISQRDGPLHDFLGMCLSGVSITLPAALVAGFFASPIFLLWFPLGSMKGVSYALGWRFHAPQLGLLATEIGEFLTGFFLCLGAGLLWWFV